MVDVIFHEGLTVPELENPEQFDRDSFPIDEIRREYDPETEPGTADTDVFIYQLKIGDTIFDFRAMRVGGDQEAEAYKQFFNEHMGENIPDSANWDLTQTRGSHMVETGYFESREEMESKILDCFQEACEQ